MQYSPKLKKAMEEIKAIVDEYDIAAHVILHTPGFSEYLYKINPSYSIAKIQHGVGGEPGVRITTNPEDPKEKKKKQLEDTINMFQHFCDIGAMICSRDISVMDMLNKHIDIETTRGDHTSHDQQNN